MKKLFFISIFLLLPFQAQAAEDYTSASWAEFDDGGDITRATSTITVSTVRFDSDSYVVKDLTISGSIGDFTHNVDFTTSNFSFGAVGLWGMDNAGNSPIVGMSGLYLYQIESSTNNEIFRFGDATTSQEASTGDVNEGTRYATIRRIGNVCTAYLYSDSERTSLSITLSVLCNDTPYQYVYGMQAFGNITTNSSTVDATISNLELTGTFTEPTVTPLKTFVAAADDLDYYGGFLNITTGHEDEVITGNKADFVTGQGIYDTGAFAGFDCSKKTVQPDANHMMYFASRGCNDDAIWVEPSDRLENYSMTNMDMQGTLGWSNVGSPTFAERVSTVTLPWQSNSWYVEGADGEGIYQNVLIRGERSGHNTSWDGQHKTTGFIYRLSGNVRVKVEDPNDTLENTRVGILDNRWLDHELTFDSSYTGSTEGTFSVVCDGACSFYISDQVMGEYNYGSVYNPYVGLDDFNSNNEEYSIQRGWEEKLIGKQWYLVNPLGHAQLIVGLNNYNNLDTNRSKTVDFQGNDFCTNINAKYSVPTNCDTAVVVRNEQYKSWGFNTIGSITTDKIHAPNIQPDYYAYIPYVLQSRVKLFALSDVGYFTLVDGGGTKFDGVWTDVFDPDWEGHFTTNGVTGAAAWGCCHTAGAGTEYRQQVSTDAAQYDITPYKSTSGFHWVNPWLIGYDLDEEPAGSGFGFNNLGYMIMKSDPVTSISAGINYTKIYFVNYLRAKYSDGGEDTFIANISRDGSDEITDPDNWITVTGTVAGKDATALTNLNTALTTTYSDWKAVWYEDGDDDVDVFSNGFDENAGFESALTAFDSGCAYSTTTLGECKWTLTTTTGTLQDVLDELHTEYSRRFHRPWYNSIFGPSGMFEGKKINFGMGVTSHPGWANGVIDPDGTTRYLDVMYSGGMGTEDGSIFTNADHNFGNPGTHDFYNVTQLPIVSESTWITADGASDTSFTGTIDDVYKTTDTTRAVYIGDGGGDTSDDWDCDTGVYASIGTYCNQNTGSFKIDDDATIYWNCTDPTDTGTCSDSGTSWWMFNEDTDAPVAQPEFGNRFIIIADQASIGNLANDDLVTTGTLMYTINSSTIYRVEMIVDNDGNFDTDYDNPHAQDQLFNWQVYYNPNHPTEIQYMMAGNGFATDRSILCYKTMNQADGGTYGVDSYAGFPNCALEFEIGDSYESSFIFGNNHFPWRDFYILDSQEKKSNMFIHANKQFMNYRHIDDNGINYVIGWHQFSATNDYGFALRGQGLPASDGGNEFRQFGWISFNDNVYNGVESRQEGADGVLGTNDDERRDYGNFVDSAGAYQRGLYRMTLPEKKFNRRR